MGATRTQAEIDKRLRFLDSEVRKLRREISYIHQTSNGDAALTDTIIRTAHLALREISRAPCLCARINVRTELRTHVELKRMLQTTSTVTPAATVTECHWTGCHVAIAARGLGGAAL